MYLPYFSNLPLALWTVTLGFPNLRKNSFRGNYMILKNFTWHDSLEVVYDVLPVRNHGLNILKTMFLFNFHILINFW